MSSTEAVTKTFDLSGYVKRTQNGSIDVQSSHLSFTQDLAQLVNAEKTDNEVIAKAVEKAFQEQNVTRLGMNAILHYAMENLEVDPTQFNTIRDRVANYVRTNTRNFRVSKGKGGGVSWIQNEHTPNTGSIAPSSSGSMRPRQNA